MAHDQLFKLVIQAFFGSFLQLFFPTEAAQLDLESVRFLDQETFTDIPDGAVRRADIVAEVRTLTGETELILVHIEIQSERRTEIPYRVWEYYSLLRLRHRRPVVPLMVYLVPGAGGITTEAYEEAGLGHTFLRFLYLVVGLPDLPAEPYLTHPEPLAAALSSLMRPQDRAASRPVRKVRTLLRVLRSGLDDARKVLLSTVVERYIPLTTIEAEEYQKMLNQQLQQELDNFVGYYEEQGIKKGLEQGIAEGVERGIAEGVERGIAEGVRLGQVRTVLRLLEARFGVLPETVSAGVEAMSADELDRLTSRLLNATSLAELGLLAE